MIDSKTVLKINSQKDLPRFEKGFKSLLMNVYKYFSIIGRAISAIIPYPFSLG